MKLLLITNNLSGKNGWSTYTLHIVEEALKRGDEVVVIVNKLFKPPTQIKSIKQILLLPQPFSIFWRPLRILSLNLKLRRVINENKPDIVHVTVEPYLILFSFIPITQPIVLTLHGTYALFPRMINNAVKRLISSYLYTRALKNVSDVISVSSRTKSMFESEAGQVLAKDINVIHNSIRPVPHKLHHPLPDKPLSIITIGAVKKRKGIDKAISFLSNWAAQNQQGVIYHIVGYADPRTEYVKSITYLAKQKSSSFFEVYLHGQIDEVDKNLLLGQSSLYIHLEDVSAQPKDVEGFGIGIIEAASYGVPALVAKGSATAEAVKDGVSGFIVSLENESAVYDKMNKLLLEKSLSKDDIVEWAELHSPEKIYEQIRQIYLSAIK